ncbi:hypothetical protein Taro_056707 [Colocasia esculenta]|uniref:Uncharacterized protein n=1 Tax=Colocasia esculenta TaxID=4460 RepID=A0A843XXH6_COLES|nr:hypothetical protein [Colocasia esculenta]
MKNWSSSVDTSPGGVDTVHQKQGKKVDTGTGYVDTSGFPKTPSGLFWDSRSTRAQAVSTQVAFLEQNTGSC